MIYFISDTHFNHHNILSYEPESRPFADIHGMNEYIIERWNERITDEDDVYVLGDFFMGKLDEIEPILSRLRGHIHLIRGNHDQPNRIKIYEAHGIDVKDIDYIKYKGRFFILCHFPIANDEFIKMVREDNSEVICLYGHVHSNTVKGYHDGMFHVGCDTNELSPISIQEIWEQSWPKENETTPEVEVYKEGAESNDPNYEGEVDCSKCEWYIICLRGRLSHAKGETVKCKKYKREVKDGGFYR